MLYLTFHIKHLCDYHILFSQYLSIEYKYSKTCLKRSLKKKTKIVFQDRLSFNAGQNIAECNTWTFIELPFAI